MLKSKIGITFLFISTVCCSSCGPGLMDGEYQITGEYYIDSFHPMGNMLTRKVNNDAEILVKENVLGYLLKEDKIVALQYNTVGEVSGEWKIKDCIYWIIDVSDGQIAGPLTKKQLESVAELDRPFQYTSSKYKYLCRG